MTKLEEIDKHILIRVYDGYYTVMIVPVVFNKIITSVLLQLFGTHTPRFSTAIWKDKTLYSKFLKYKKKGVCYSSMVKTIHTDLIIL